MSWPRHAERIDEDATHREERATMRHGTDARGGPGNDTVDPGPAGWRPTRRRLLGATGAAGILALGGTIVPRGTVRGAAAQDPPPRPGGELVIATPEPGGNLDPVFTNHPQGNWLLMQLYDRLVRLDRDGGAVEPALAESWEVGPGGLSYTFRLREALFHDGAPVTADDVVFSLDRMAAALAAQPLPLRFPGWELAAPDARTVVVRLEGAWAPFLANLTHPVASVLPRRLIEEQKLLFFDRPVGSGPFAFESAEPGVGIVLARHAGYWDEGRPYLDRVTFADVVDPEERLAGFLAGEIDVLAYVGSEQVAALEDDPEVSVTAAEVFRTDFLHLNASLPPFDDAELRRAINHAVDREAIVAEAMGGAGEPATTYLPPGIAGHDAANAGFPFDLERAEGLVAASIGAAGFESNFVVLEGDTNALRIGQLVADQVARIGGRIEVVEVTREDLGGMIQANRLGMGLDGYGSWTPDPDFMSRVLARSGFAGTLSHFADDRIDALVEAAAAMGDPAERERAYGEIQALVNDHAPYVLLAHARLRIATRAHVRNFRVLPTLTLPLWEVWRDDA